MYVRACVCIWEKTWRGVAWRGAAWRRGGTVCCILMCDAVPCRAVPCRTVLCRVVQSDCEALSRCFFLLSSVLYRVVACGVVSVARHTATCCPFLPAHLIHAEIPTSVFIKHLECSPDCLRLVSLSFNLSSVVRSVDHRRRPGRRRCRQLRVQNPPPLPLPCACLRRRGWVEEVGWQFDRNCGTNSRAWRHSHEHHCPALRLLDLKRLSRCNTVRYLK